MKFTELGLPGVWLIEPELASDERGVFRRHFCRDEFAAHAIETTVAQGNISENPHLGTLRGFHYQRRPFAEAKTLSCLTGAIHDIVADLRADSPTYMEWVGVDLAAADRRSLHVPVGCANAWLTTAADTTIHYYMSETYQHGSYGGIRYDDPAFGFVWPAAPTVISEKDRTFSDFDPASAF